MIGNSHLLNMRKNYDSIKALNELDYKIFSQNGEDGIIDYLLKRLKIYKPKFIEIGVGDYTECNTRFVFERTSSKGLIIDCINDFENKVKRNIKLWRGDLKIIEKMINSNNIIETLNKNNFLKNLDLFSLDIDGTDYWIIKKLPKNFAKIAVLEYNSTFGPNLNITVPDIQNFKRSDYHYSHLCFGCSLKALIHLMIKKNFTFIGSDLTRCNAFFINNKFKKKLKLKFPRIDNLSSYTNSNIRESRNRKGKLSYLSGEDRINKIKNCRVFDLNRNKIDIIKNIL